MNSITASISIIVTGQWLIAGIYISAKCEDPVTQIDNYATALGYRNPALEDNNIAFSCAPGLILTGPNTSLCMGNGEWEPNPAEVKCLGE